LHLRTVMLRGMDYIEAKHLRTVVCPLMEQECSAPFLGQG